jgi:conjugative transfer region protein TrbK
MDGKTFARLGAVIFIAVALTAMAIGMARPPERATPAPARPTELVRDPLREDQRRCQHLGEVAARDEECLRVWAETRRRFLGQTPPLRSDQGH